MNACSDVGSGERGGVRNIGRRTLNGEADIVEINGKIIDGSLRHRLREVKEVMNYENET